MDPNGVHLTVDEATATITLARPEKRNALSLEMLGSLGKALEAVPTDAGVVILAADGKVFSAGHDMGEIDRPTRQLL